MEQVFYFQTDSNMADDGWYGSVDPAVVLFF
jgi:hypothetical protein